MTVLEFDSKRCVGQCLAYDTFHLNGFFFRQGLKFSLLKRLANCAETARLLQCNRPLFGQEFLYPGHIRGPARKLIRLSTGFVEYLRKFRSIDQLGAQRQKVL